MKDKDIVFPLKIPVELYVEAKALAKKQSRSIASVIRQGLKEFLNIRNHKK